MSFSLPSSSSSSSSSSTLDESHFDLEDNKSDPQNDICIRCKTNEAFEEFVLSSPKLFVGSKFITQIMELSKGNHEKQQNLHFNIPATDFRLYLDLCVLRSNEKNIDKDWFQWLQEKDLNCLYWNLFSSRHIILMTMRSLKLFLIVLFNALTIVCTIKSSITF